ncbi:MAG: InlB B-repeat-containing protein [Bacteroidota bacterium]
MTANITVTANLAIDAFTLTYTAGANGTISGTSPQTVTYGANGTAVMAVPNTGYHFVNWGDGSTSNPRTDQHVSDNKSVTANFASTTQYTLTVTVTNGTVVKNPDQTSYNNGTTVQLTATPATGYTFTSWSGDASGSANPLTVTMNGNKNIAANFAPIQYTLTLVPFSGGNNGRGSVTGAGTVTSGVAQAITASPGTGSQFSFWWVLSGTASIANQFSSNTTVTLTSGDATVGAYFYVPEYNLTTSSNPTNAGTISGGGTFVNGQTATVTATPGSGGYYSFTNWSGDASGTTNPLTITMDGNKNIIANFSRSTPPYTLTINATNGTVTKNPDQTNYADATSVQLTATPQTNYVFTGWSGDASGTTNPLTVTMDGNKNITANFIATYTLTISATCGTVSKNLEQTNYTDGTSVQLTATPQTNYVFTGWSGDATGTTNPLTVTMDGNKNITANFALAYQIATNIASKSFTANWEAKSGATGYILDVSTDWYFTSTSDKVVGYDNKDVGNTTSYSVTGLSPNTRYYFRVRSYNGTQMSGAYSFAIDVITAPDVPQPPNPYTSVSTQSLSFSSSGESKTVTVSSNTGWGVSSNFNLIKTIVGGSGNGSIKITLPERQWYPGVQQENFYRVSVGTAGLITVSQEAPTGPYTNISPTSVSFGPSGGQAYVDMISSNTIFGTEVFSTSKNWISAGWDWLASPHAKISITCAKNMIMTPRSGTVTISYYGITTATITVSQAAGDPYVNTDPARLLFFASGGSTNVTVSSNTSWSASTSDSWLSASGAGTGNGSITIACTKNTGTSARIGTVSVSGGGNITVYQGRQMYAKINGNLYPFDDLITDSLQSIYNANSDAIKNLLKAKIDAECNNKMGFPPDNYRYQVPWPTELQPITFSQEGTDLYASLKINNLRIHWDQSYHGLYTTICKLESTQKDIPGWITIKARIQLLRDGTKYSLNLDNPSIDVSNFVFRSDDDAVKLFASGTVNDVNHMISASTDEMIQGITNNFHFPIELSNLKEFGGYPLTPDQAQEVLNAVPIIISLGTPINGNLVINLDIMPGGSDPALPTNPHYSYAGFASPYYAFQQSLLLPGVSTKTEQQQILIDKMADYGANAIRCSIPWGEIFPSLTPGNLINGNPDDLVAGTTLDGAISAIPTTVWANTDMIFERASARGLQVIPQIPQQEQDLPKINGHIIAPDPVKQGDGYSDSCYYVAPNTYLYYLKIFVNAAVKKYGNRVSIWTIESEFNAARIGTFIQWRHGDSWQKTASGEFQDRYWRILVNAVRNNDPTAKVASNLHILNLMDGINRLGPDLDIIGLDVYPNMYTAYPVIGDIVGEFVRATRRVLNNRGWANKEVQVMEASYPGIDPSMDPSDGVSIDECMYKFSYYRQKKFVEDAVNSALKFGAKGFFYWGFLDDENNKSAPDGKFINFGSLVDIHTNRSSYSFKPAASAFLTTGITGGLAKRSHGNEEETIATVPTEYGLSQNYPNPFNPTTVVSYQLPAAGHMTLKIYDMLGREVVTLVDGIKNAGYYNATFDASRLASGVYFTRFTAQPQDGSKSFVQVRKMLMMK